MVPIVPSVVNVEISVVVPFALVGCSVVLSGGNGNVELEDPV